MIYRKLISALVFVVFGFCFSEAARAQSCNIFAPDFDPFFCDPFDPSCACNSWIYFCPDCTMDSTTGSTVHCAFPSGGSTVLNKDAETFAQTSKAVCTHTADNNQITQLGTCDFELLMSGVTLSTGCATGGECHVEGFCTNSDLQVTGSVSNCSLSPFSVLNMGIAGIQRNKNKCELVFPDGILPKNKVLDVTFTTENGVYVSIGETKARSCNSPNLNNSAVQCIAANGVVRRTNEAADNAVQFDFNVRQTVNQTTCKAGSDKGNANIDIFGSNTFDVADINLSSLQCLGAPLTCGDPTNLNTDAFPDRACKIDTCPTFGPALAQLPRNPDGTVTVTCTGSLNSNQAILGFDEVATSP